MHGYAADKLGDPTARYAGRLTLNPIPHIDPIGSILLPLVLVLSGSPIFSAGQSRSRIIPTIYGRDVQRGDRCWRGSGFQRGYRGHFRHVGANQF
jgi:hypothetical protein